MRDHYDIVIAGGGMVGVSLALQLDAVLPAELSMLVLEGFALPDVQRGAPEYHPSFDARSTAISHGSRLIYEGMRVWDALSEWVCPIERIHVSSRGHFGSALLRAGDYDWPALGYVVENAWLGSALLRQLLRRERIDVRSPAQVLGATPGESGVSLRLQGEASAVHAGLLVVADGASSVLRKDLGVAAAEQPCRQHALVANVACAQAHDGCAYERFTDEGPLALLPLLPAAGAGHRCALVWTLPPERARQLRECDEADFLRALQQRFGYRLGRLLQVGERHAYPLSLMRASEQVRRGVVVMGNAAHTLHPVAGQGFNLALRDVAQLGRVLAEGVAGGLPPGDLGVLQRYQRLQRADQRRTIEFSDRVPGLFMHRDPLLGAARDLALAGLDILPALKREFVRHAAGMVATHGAERA